MGQLTAVIVCKNEQDNIVGCLESLRDVADEILVADSGSTDDTLAIVSRLGGCRLIRGEWTGYAPFRNWAVSHVRHPWVLIVDADERVTPDLAAEIRKVLARPQKGVDGYKVGFITYFMGHRLRFSNWNRPSIRLVRRERCRFEPKQVHERIVLEPSRVRRLRHKLLHYSISDCDDFLNKYAIYTRLAAGEMWYRGRRAGFASLLIRPLLRFVSLYVIRGGFLDGIPGLQVCMLMAFFNTFVKQARLWEFQWARQPEGPNHLDDRSVLPYRVDAPDRRQPHYYGDLGARPTAQSMPSGDCGKTGRLPRQA